MPPVRKSQRGPREHVQRLVHELRVHARELEEQNEELRSMRAKLELANRRYADLYDFAPVGYMSLDRDGIIVEANLTAAHLLAEPRLTLVGSPLARFVTLADRAALGRHLSDVFGRQQRRACELAFENPKLDRRFIGQLESDARLDPDEGAGLCRTSLSDVSERARRDRDAAELHREEEALRRQAETARARLEQVAVASARLVESLDLGSTVASAARLGVPELGDWCAIDLVDRDGAVRRAEEAFEDAALGSLPIDPYAPRGAAVVVRSGQPVLVSAPSPSDVVALSRSAQQLEALFRWVGSYLCVPLRGHGRTLGAISFVRAKGRPAYDDGDLEVAQELARRAALAIDNARLYAESRDADRRKDEFLAMLGHELRNPLAAIVFAVEHLRRQLPQGTGAPAQGTLGVVERQSERLVRLVDDLLEVSRITQGKVTLRKEVAELGPLLKRAVETVRPLLQQRAHLFEMASPAEPVVVEVDPMRLEQAVANLVGNAAKYTEPGGRIRLEVRLDERDVVLAVRDNGVGIAPELLPRIFEPFTQLRASLDRADGGLGIGLALTRSLVELHGGTVLAHSGGPGKGSEFVVRLPARPARDAHEAVAPIPGPEPPAARPAARPRFHRVMVVDDNEDLLEMLRACLETWGCQVDVARDAPECLQVVERVHPEMMLLDVGLPGMSGYELARRLREVARDPKPYLVAMTGYGAESDKAEAREAGFDLHLTKPVTEERLREIFDQDGPRSALASSLPNDTPRP